MPLAWPSFQAMFSAYRPTGFTSLGLAGSLYMGSRAGGLLGGLTGIAMVIVALFRAGGARACVAQPLKAKVRLMAVVPLNVHSGTGGDVYFDRLGIDYGHIDKYIQAGVWDLSLPESPQSL